MWSVNANRSQGARAVGGRLSLTTTHLRFMANGLDRGTGGRDWAAPLRDVASVDVAGRSLQKGPFSGGLRRRLLLTLRSGETEAFVVNSVENVVQRVRSAL